MNKINELPVSLTGYFPLEYLTSEMITLTGMQYILTDRSLGEGTIELLKQSELTILNKTKNQTYLYLLEEHDPRETYLLYFRRHYSIGKTHLSMLIKENCKQTYAELVASFSIDKKIPYIVALMLLEDYKKVCGSLTVYIVDCGNYREVPWIPEQTKTPPPINYRKMMAAHIQSNPNVDDNYILATLRDFCYNKSLTAKVLNITQFVLVNRLKKLNVLRDDGTLNKKMVDSLLDMKIGEITAESKKKTHKRVREGPFPHQIPPKNKNQELPESSNIPPEEEIRRVYEISHDARTVAEELGIPYISVLSFVRKWTKIEEDINSDD